MVAQCYAEDGSTYDCRIMMLFAVLITAIVIGLLSAVFGTIWHTTVYRTFNTKLQDLIGKPTPPCPSCPGCNVVPGPPGPPGPPGAEGVDGHDASIEHDEIVEPDNNYSETVGMLDDTVYEEDPFDIKGTTVPCMDCAGDFNSTSYVVLSGEDSEPAMTFMPSDVVLGMSSYTGIHQQQDDYLYAPENEMTSMSSYDGIEMQK